MKTRKLVACLLLVLQLAFPLLLTAGVRGEERAAAARRAEVIERGDPVLLQLTFLSMNRAAASDRYNAYFSVCEADCARPGEYFALRESANGCYLGGGEKEPPSGAPYLSYDGYRTELAYGSYLISEADAAALAAAASYTEVTDDWIWFEEPEGEVFLSVRLLNGDIAVTGLTVNGTEYPLEKETAVN